MVHQQGAPQRSQPQSGLRPERDVRREDSGFTLTELMVVVALLGILMALATINLPLARDKYTVESRITEIHGILMTARNDAMNTNIPRLISLTANQMQVYQDTDDSGTVTAGDVLTATIGYPGYTIISSGVGPPWIIGFNRRGMANLPTASQTIRITGYQGAPATDCLVVSALRVNKGHWNTGTNTCDQR